MADNDEPLVTMPRVAAGAVASVASFVVATQLGVIGTVVGVALISVIATVSSAFLEEYLGRGHQRLKEARRATVDTGVEPLAEPTAETGSGPIYDTWGLPAVDVDTGHTPTPSAAGTQPLPDQRSPAEQPAVGAARTEPDAATAGTAPTQRIDADGSAQASAATQRIGPDQGPGLGADPPTQLLPTVAEPAVAPPGTDAEPVGAEGRRRRPLSWRSKRLWLPMLAVFGFAMGAVVVAELTGQTPPRGPAPAPVVTTTVTATPSPSPQVTATATPDATATGSPVPTPTTSPTPTAAVASPTPLAEPTPAP